MKKMYEDNSAYVYENRVHTPLYWSAVAFAVCKIGGGYIPIGNLAAKVAFLTPGLGSATAIACSVFLVITTCYNLHRQYKILSAEKRRKKFLFYNCPKPQNFFAELTAREVEFFHIDTISNICTLGIAGFTTYCASFYFADAPSYALGALFYFTWSQLDTLDIPYISTFRAPEIAKSFVDNFIPFASSGIRNSLSYDIAGIPQLLLYNVCTHTIDFVKSSCFMDMKSAGNACMNLVADISGFESLRTILHDTNKKLVKIKLVRKAKGVGQFVEASGQRVPEYFT